MPAVLLCAHFTDKELTLRTQARAVARRTLPGPAATARALALAICEVEAGLRSASQLERICHPSLWDAVANRIQRAGGPPVSGSSVLRLHVQELMPGLVDAVAVVRRGRPEHGSRTFHAFAHHAEVAAHPHPPRHSLASAMRRQGTRQRDRRAAHLAVKALSAAG